MKRVGAFLFTIVLLIIVVAGCTPKEEMSLPLQTYVFESSEDIMKPSITLEEGETFTFFFSGISSYIGQGSYEISDGRLILKTNDGKYRYLFDITDKELSFVEEGSSTMTWFSNISNGSVFK